MIMIQSILKVIWMSLLVLCLEKLRFHFNELGFDSCSMREQGKVFITDDPIIGSMRLSCQVMSKVDQLCYGIMIRL
jgi:hypothetical protein